MKTLFTLLLFATLYQTRLTQQDCQKIWRPMRSAILSKNLDSTLLFFTDNEIRNFRDGDNKSLKDMIKNRWFNEKYFIAAIKEGKYKYQIEDASTFHVHIRVQFPKAADEEGDGALVYDLEFKKIDGKYMVRQVSIAG